MSTAALPARLYRPSYTLLQKTVSKSFNCRSISSCVGPPIQKPAFRNRQTTQFFRALHVTQHQNFATTKKPTAKSAKSTRLTSADQEELALKMASANGEDHFLTLSCPDKSGIVYAVTGLLAAQNLTILDLQQFSDPASKNFFMRVHFGHTTDVSSLQTSVAQLAKDMQMDYSIRPVNAKPKVLIMVSKIGHCLNDLLFRVKSGQLKIDIPAIVSNHAEFQSLAQSYGIPFYHLPVTKDTKTEQETQILDLIKEHSIDLVVLARYMQVLSPRLCTEMSGRIINIHHSFLPSFKGAKPYHQAYERGVKIIGATAHFVTADLDEGPIIEQRVARVDHALSPKELVEEGSNVESQVLAAAVKWWSERRVFLNGAKTVVFN
ncbi:Formyltetrahydrofolate deformylase [Massarina eburnea CBS 473.64]|uniref:Formyltetrahydrofolate deformylase n=1 Tax=Massarina eburnea CBS 473.64 TaxID=1395130 RepID=A0A6A6RHV7_9PLEO|nr:Formyltetrahydrofolate deformylase [Massarina eburnea CBS 473.64]